MHSRLLPALAASLLLHLMLLVAVEWGTGQARPPAAPAMLNALLLPPAQVRPATDTLLKNTLSDGLSQGAALPAPGRARPREEAQRKLSEHLYYPPEAVAEGIEGEVRLLLTLDPEGNIIDAQIASGSGHEVLDRAAVRAARAMGRLPGAGMREIILPVEFRLR